MIGAPHIWNGDEMGMTGADDPDNRKPLIWPDLSFDDETPSTFSKIEYQSTPKFNDQLYEYYQSLITLRKSHEVLRKGDYEPIILDGLHQILAYKRSDGHQTIKVVINTSNTPVELGIQDLERIIFDHDSQILEDVLTLSGHGGFVYEVKY